MIPMILRSCLSALLLSAGACEAGLLAGESFEYTAGTPLPGQAAGGPGFAGTWREVVNSAVLVPGSLSWSGAGGTLASSGNHVRIGQGRNLLDINPAAFSGFLDNAGNAGADGTVLYVSFLMQVTAPGSDPFVGFGFHRDGDADQNFHVHVDNSTANHGTDKFYLTDWTGPALNQNAEVLGGASTAVNLFVLRFDFAAGPDSVRCYTNPPLGAEPANADGTISGANLSWDRVAFANFGGGSADLLIDEIRIGTTFASVTPAAPPPPEWLDLSFNGTGKFTKDFEGRDDISYRSALQADGRIVTAGYTHTGTNHDFMVMRQMPDGGVDAGFGTGGRTTVAFGSGEDFCNSLVLQPDGKIIAGGYAFMGTDYDYALVRLNADGALDTTFGIGGKVVTAFGPDDNYITNLALQADGKILALGYTLNLDMCLARYLPNGTLDPSFGAGGIVQTDISGLDDYAYAIAVQPDGKIVVGGYADMADREFAVVRYLPTGSLDTTFGSGGIFVTRLSAGTEAIFSLALQTDGKIVAAGYAHNGFDLDFGIMRLTPSGSLDPDFAGGGRILYPVRGGTDIAQDLVVQANGKIFVAGYGVNAGGGTDTEVMRLNPDGTPDSTFDGDGRLVTTAPGSAAVVDVLLMPDGRLLATGFVNPGTGQDCLFIRYDGEPVPAITVRNGPSGSDPVIRDGQIDRISCGSVPFGNAAPARVFTISNAGRLPLTGLAVTIDGPDQGDFSLAGPLAISLAPGASTTFSVTFTPGSPALLRTAFVHIVSNDVLNSPFDFPVSGSGLVSPADWRLYYFGSSADSGAGADAADFDGDGISNLMEFATGTNPAQSSGVPVSFSSGNPGELIFYRSRDSMNAGIFLTPEYNAGLDSEDWTSAGISLTILADDGHTQQICASLPGNPRRRLVRLTASTPAAE